MSPQGNIWIQGAGEMASAAALCLFRAGYRVMMAEIPHPLAVRRWVTFAEAVYSGSAHVGEVLGQWQPAAAAEFVAGFVPVIIDPDAGQLSRLAPAAVLDARMTKLEAVSLTWSGVPVVGLGPGFTCGVNADLVIETHREAGPGKVIRRGSASANTGIPGIVAGRGVERILRSPAAGRLRPECAIGDIVRRGQIVGWVAGLPVTSVLEGMVRGLVHERAELSVGEKVGDIDPRGENVDPRQVTDKGLAIGYGVREALVALGVIAVDA